MGAQWLAGGIGDAAKNAYVFSAKDSLFMTMRQAKAVYESAIFDDGFGGFRYASTRSELETAFGAAITGGELALSPPAPASFDVLSGAGSADLSWSLNTSVSGSIAGYRLYRALDNFKNDSVWTVIAELPSGATSYTDYDVTPGYSYFYYLTTFDGDGRESTMHTRTSEPMVPLPGPTVQSVTVSATGPFYAGSSYPITATALLEDYSTQDVTAGASWATSDASVATAGPNGQLACYQGGSARITATYQNVSGYLDITVVSDEYVSGTITTTTWTQGTYHVTDAVTIPAGNTLTIEPGVNVVFDADVQFVVEGSLHAVGAPRDSIRFIKGTAAEWGGIRISGGDSSTMAYARISDGHADGASPGNDGGGIKVVDSRLGLAHVVVSGNEAANSGGGIHTSGAASNVTLDHCAVAGNTAKYGGGVYAYVGTASITHCTLTGNTATTEAGGIYSNTSTLTLTNSILWGNSAPASVELRNLTSTVSANYCDIGQASGYAGGGNINADPMFVDAANGNYRLQEGSPCIDTGDPASPLDPDGTQADMGAYFYDQTPNALVLPEVSTLPGTYVNVPIVAMYNDIYAADLAFTFDPNVMGFQGITYHAFQNQPNADWATNVMGNVLYLSLSAGGLQNPVSLDEEVLVELVFWIPSWVAPHTTVPLAWRPFPETNVNEQEANTVDGSLYVRNYDYGDVTKDGNLTAYDASYILQYVVRIVTSIDHELADVTGNGTVSGYDAAHVIEKVINPSFVFPVEQGLLIKVAPTTPRLLSWVRDGEAWNLRVDDPTGVRGGELTFDAASEITVSGGEHFASQREGSTVRVAFARLEDGEPVLLRFEGRSLRGGLPSLTEAQLNEGQIPLASLHPIRFALEQNAPNPFNPVTTIRFSVPQEGQARLVVYNLNGQAVRTLVDGPVHIGVHAVTWDGRDAAGRELGSGLYLYRLTTGGENVIRRMTLVR